jgi:hypothetical protein
MSNHSKTCLPPPYRFFHKAQLRQAAVALLVLPPLSAEPLSAFDQREEHPEYDHSPASPFCIILPM